jgi:4-amino-4-deoxy-L-arabinose transferase-like glycosyltransferase
MKSVQPGWVLLLIAITGIALFYGYPAMWQLLPQGSHMWRQADCMAMTDNYRIFQLPFLQPETYNLQSVDGKVAGEFPLFYFIASRFEHSAFALRLMHTILFLAGISAAYFIAFYFLRRQLLSIFSALLLFTSPLLVFYGNNFLSDVPALSAAYIGWAFFLYHYRSRQLQGFILSLLFFAIAVLLKASHAIQFILIGAVLISETVSGRKTKLLLSFIALLGAGSWYIYAKSYNQLHQDAYYFLSLAPVWKATWYETGLGIWRMTVSLSGNYFWQPTSLLLLLSSYVLLKKWMKLPKTLRLLIAVSFVLTLFYVLLFYKKLIGHEYYYTVFFVFGYFAIVGSLKAYNSYHAENIFGHTALFILLLVNIIYCRNFVQSKLTDNLYNGYLSTQELQSFLITHGVSKTNTVLSLPDDSPNKTLSLIKRKGYTEFNPYDKVLKEQKAEYLLLGNEVWKQDKAIQPFLKDSIGRYYNFTLYKLK